MITSALPLALPAGEEFSGLPVFSSSADGTAEGRTWPLVDMEVLEDLEDQLGEADLATNFVKDYAALWEPRERRLAAALAVGDRTAALDAAISLKVSSAMVGAHRLAGLARALESLVRKGNLHRGSSVLTLISVQGKATVRELETGYLRRRG